MNYQYTYLLNIRYFGFRLHGWQKQPNLKTVHLFVDKTLKFVVGSVRCKTVGVGRTDAKVSAINYPLQLFIDESLDIDSFIQSFNKNSPSDLQILQVRKIKDVSFNIIQHEKVKQYHYYFSNEGKNHPFCAAFITGYSNLDVELMIRGAKLFEGTHYFRSYCAKPSQETKLIRTIDSCEIVVNDIHQASFFPKKSYVFKVRGKGFLRYQVRLMMGALIELGSGQRTLEDIKESLIEKEQTTTISTIAPGSALQLHAVEFKNLDKFLD